MLRRGRRAGRGSLVAHACTIPWHDVDRNDQPRVGFVVSRAVGGSVTRHRVQRRLRHIVRSRLDVLRPGTRLVVRALPAAATATSDALAVDLDALLRRLNLVDPS